jgi:MFS family permease
MRQRIITRTVWMLSLVSLFTDMASEMLYPVMPLYLKEIGFSIIGIGVLEGIAEAVAGLSKGYFGAWSDSIGKRMPFVRWGYGLSAGSKPLLALFSWWPWIFFCRTLDRIGKGLRTAPRDALLSDEATPVTKGRVFGLHRSMDTVGAMIGPAAALLYLYYFPSQYKELFLWAFIPGVAAIVVTFVIRERPHPNKDLTPNPSPKERGMKKTFSFKTSFQYLPKAALSYRMLVIPLLVFTFFNSSDVFLLLRMKEVGLSDTALIGVYIFYNAVYAALAYPLGHLADKIGLKKVLLTGLFLFALVYVGMSFFNSWMAFAAMFLLYGVYAAATEGVAKAWISNIVPKDQTATAIGTYEGFRNLSAMFASFIAGILWQNFGAMAAFLSTAIVTLLVTAFIYFRVKEGFHAE